MNKQQNLYEMTAKIAEDWAQNAESHINQKVSDILSSRLDSLILTICGLESSQIKGDFRYWKVDHCNGRGGNSPVGQILLEAVKSTLSDISKDIHISNDELAQIRKTMNDEYIRSYKMQVSNRASSLGKEHADKYIKRTIESALDGSAESARLMLIEANKLSQ